MRGLGAARALVLAVDAPTLTPADLAPLLAVAGAGAAYEGLHLPMVAALDALPGEAPAPLAARLAGLKAAAIAAHHPDAWVIGADQVAEVDGQAIGKPGSGEHDHKTFELNSIHGPVKGTIGTPASGQPDPPDPPQNSAGSGGPEGAHQHHVLIPEKMRRLKPGDRVLVAWVQSEAVVVDIICPAEDLKK